MIQTVATATFNPLERQSRGRGAGLHRRAERVAGEQPHNEPHNALDRSAYLLTQIRITICLPRTKRRVRLERASVNRVLDTRRRSPLLHRAVWG